MPLLCKELFFIIIAVYITVINGIEVLIRWIVQMKVMNEMKISKLQISVPHH